MSTIQKADSFDAQVTPLYPPFQYGDPQDGVSVPMTQLNSAPALVVWLCLVTNPDFLNDLSSGTNRLVSIDKIAAATNLTSNGVQKILDKFLQGGALQNKFMAIATAFQNLQGVRYPHGNCPSFDTIISLANTGAATDPLAGV